MARLNVDVLVAGLEEYFATPEMKELINKIQDGGIVNKLVTAGAVIIEAVKIAEKMVIDLGEIGAGSEKKEAVKAWIDKCVDLPFYLEMLDGIVAGIMIDAVVTYYNAKFGRQWLNWILKYI